MILERELFIMQHIGMHTVAVLSIVSTVLIIAIVCPGGKRNPKINIRAQLKILMEKPIITQETVCSIVRILLLVPQFITKILI